MSAWRRIAAFGRPSVQSYEQGPHERTIVERVPAVLERTAPRSERYAMLGPGEGIQPHPFMRLEIRPACHVR
ncbi:MAG: hypothetical protein AAEC10_04040, partial [Rhodospirillales bacterium]